VSTFIDINFIRPARTRTYTPRSEPSLPNCRPAVLSRMTIALRPPQLFDRFWPDIHQPRSRLPHRLGLGTSPRGCLVRPQWSSVEGTCSYQIRWRRIPKQPQPAPLSTASIVPNATADASERRPQKTAPAQQPHPGRHRWRPRVVPPPGRSGPRHAFLVQSARSSALATRGIPAFYPVRRSSIKPIGCPRSRGSQRQREPSGCIAG